MNFSFDMQQRVNVPGIKGPQAVIVGVFADAVKGNSYQLRFLRDGGDAIEVTTTESALVTANMEEGYTDHRALKFPDDDMTDKQRADWLREQATKLREAARPWDRLARLGFNDKRKPTRKSKSKSKRRK